MRWGPEYLATFTAALFSNLEFYIPEARRDVDEILDTSKPWAWSSGCSGTDCPAWVHEALETFPSCRRRFVHLVAAEIEPDKREFIRLAPVARGRDPPSQLFKDIFDLSRPLAANVATRWRAA